LTRWNQIDAELADTLQSAHAAARRKSEQRARMALAHYKDVSPDLLDTPEAQPVIARLGEACGEMALDVDRVAYVKAVALDVLAAKASPRCPQGDRMLDQAAQRKLA
jgi:hypothetical protein